jgi:hypothetical protein
MEWPVGRHMQWAACVLRVKAVEVCGRGRGQRAVVVKHAKKETRTDHRAFVCD